MIVEEEKLTKENKSILDVFYESLPARPYHSNNVSQEGVKIRPKEEAIKYKQVQFNHPSYKKWIVIDYDKDEIQLIDGKLVKTSYGCDALGALEANNLPYPNIYVSNPANGHAHLFYCLETPVYNTENSSQKAISYFKKIEAALREKIGGDRAYSSLIAKNPLHKDWRVQVFRDEPFELDEIAEYVTLPQRVATAVKRPDVAGLGRNSTIFEIVRFVGYANIKFYDSYSDFYDFILSSCQIENVSFLEMLGCKEIEQIAKSISKWIWKHNDPYYSKRKLSYEEFCQKQKVRSIKGAKIGGETGGRGRTKEDEKKRIKAAKYKDKGLSITEIANKLKVDKSTVSRWFK
ncbi:replication initiation protein [Comamonas aquatica]|uniref:Replication initiation protein n=1 Tax=Comamonas aquatica TaxID=225991 RepID=A0AA42KYF3_9BURK|nr:replication initiation protein [Comamonas aquatica]MDH0362192.1 replication initiation protein [Comamonas aquatica]